VTFRASPNTPPLASMKTGSLSRPMRASNSGDPCRRSWR
jgi:hypothetical protein